MIKWSIFQEGVAIQNTCAPNISFKTDQKKKKWDTISYLLKGLKIKKTDHSVSKNVEELELFYIDGANIKYYDHSGKQFSSVFERPYSSNMMQSFHI